MIYYKNVNIKNYTDTETIDPKVSKASNGKIMSLSNLRSV